MLLINLYLSVWVMVAFSRDVVCYVLKQDLIFQWKFIYK